MGKGGRGEKRTVKLKKKVGIMTPDSLGPRDTLQFYDTK